MEREGNGGGREGEGVFGDVWGIKVFLRSFENDIILFIYLLFL